MDTKLILQRLVLLVLMFRLSESLTYNTKIGRFSVDGDTAFDLSYSALVTYTSRSLVLCVNRFHFHEDGCIADYDNVTNTCKIYTTGCCDRVTRNAPGFYAITRDLSGFNSQPRDCTFHKNKGEPDGVYQIYPEGIPNGLPVNCDMTTDGGGWTVIQNRFDGSVDFYNTWEQYKTGFGDVTGEYWLGNENIHLLTKDGGYVLRIDMQDNSDATSHVVYGTFSVAGESDNYNLTIGEYCTSSTADDDGMFGMSQNNGDVFSTHDRNSAVDINGDQCTTVYQSGWWFAPSSCTTVNLNGLYGPGSSGNQYNNWFPWTFNVGMKTSSMKIRRK